MALLSSEHVDVAICTYRTQTFHADAFKAVGADPADYRVVVVKSAQHFYNGFVGLAKEILYVASPGAADPDVTRWPYTKRKTPFWPKTADPWK
jgi:microcystin degradation protein MlrC